MHKTLNIFVTVIAALSALMIALGSFVTVDAGTRGVHLRAGKIIGVMEPGLNFKLPVVDSVREVTVQNVAVTYERVQAYSRDQQTADMRVSVNYHIPHEEVAELYRQYGTVESLQSRVIDRTVPNIVENTFGQYTAVSSVQDRAKLTADIASNLRQAANGPFVIDSVQLENIDFSSAYEKSIEDRMKAEVAIQTQKQNLETERVNADIAVTKAKAEAESKLVRARADAEATRIQGEADADAIKARGDALKQNSGLVELTAAERWDGHLPQTMIPGSSVPFISVK